MKKIISALLLASVLFALAGCGAQQQQQTQSPVEAYKSAAQKYIDSGDYESAIKALEEGIAQTKDPQLQTMLDDLKAQQTAEAETTDPTDETQEETQPEEKETPEEKPSYEQYAGFWGNCEMEVRVSGPYFTVFVERSGSYRIASFEENFSVNDIQDDSVSFSFMDSWGNYGNCELTFAGDHIVMTVSDVVWDEYAMYGIEEGTVHYYRNYVDYSAGSESTAPVAESGKYDHIVGSYYCNEYNRNNWTMYIEYAVGSSEQLIATVPLPLKVVTVYLTQDDDTHFSGPYGSDGSEPDGIIHLEIKANGDITVGEEDYYYGETFYYEYKPKN